MSKAEVRYRRPLNNEQLFVLRLLYFYRFGTCTYIADYMSKSNKVMQKKLKILEDQGFIDKRYDKTYKLKGKPAEYYLKPKGARLLMGKIDKKTYVANRVTSQGIKTLYKNPTVSEDFTAHCLRVLQTSMHLYDLYKHRKEFYTQVHLKAFSFMPSWQPDGCISLKTRTQDKRITRYYFLDIWDGSKPFFVSVRKARYYITYAEEGHWPTGEGSLPVVLMVCDTELTEKKLRRQIRRVLDESYTKVQYATTTMQRFLQATNNKVGVWRSMHEGAELYTLPQLPI